MPHTSRMGSYIRRLWRSSTDSSYRHSYGKRSYKNSYNDIEGGHPKQHNNAEDDSVRKLVDLGPATNIISHNIPLDDRPAPQEGIKVETTLSSNSMTKQARV